MAHKLPSCADYRKFGLFLAALFLVIGVYPLWRGTEPRWWALVIAGILAAGALAIPIAVKPLYLVSLKAGGVLGWINTRIILGLLFYLVITPIGLVLRAVRREVTWATRTRQADYWHARESVELSTQMRHMF
jgi:hypothetical protein